MQVPADLDKLGPCQVDLTLADELSWRVGHESSQANKHEHAPGNLEAEREAPLLLAVVEVRAAKAYPVGHHGAKGYTAARDSAYHATLMGRRNFAEVDGDGRYHATEGVLAGVWPRVVVGVDSPNGKASHGSPGKEHANVDRGGLDGGSDGDNNAHHLHESNAAEAIADGGLCESSKSLAGNVNGYNLMIS